MKNSGSKILTIAGIAIVMVAIAVWLASAPVAHAQGRSRTVPNTHTTIYGGNGLGVNLQEIEQPDVARLKLPALAGALVSSVRADGPAARAGFKVEDVVVSFDGEAVRSAKQLTRMIDETPEGRDVEAVVIRDGAKMTLNVAPAPSDAMNRVFSLNGLNGTLQPFQFSSPNGNGFIFGQPLLNDRFNMSGADVFANNNRRLGVEVQELTGQLGDYFGTKDGVLITSVEENTPAKTAGLKPGDVITKVNNRLVTGTDDLRRRITSADNDVTITIFRDRKEMAVTVKLGSGDTPKTIIK